MANFETNEDIEEQIFKQHLRQRERSVRSALDSIEYTDHSVAQRNGKAVIGGALIAAVVGVTTMFTSAGAGGVTTAALNPLGFVAEHLSTIWPGNSSAGGAEECGPLANDAVLGALGETGTIKDAAVVAEATVVAQVVVEAVLPPIGPGDIPLDFPGGHLPLPDRPTDKDPDDEDPHGNPPSDKPRHGKGDLIDVKLGILDHDLLDIELLRGDLVDVDVEILENGTIVDGDIEVGKGKNDIIDVEFESSHETPLNLEVEVFQNSKNELLDVEVDLDKETIHDVVDVEIKGNDVLESDDGLLGGLFDHGDDDGLLGGLFDHDDDDEGLLGGLLGH